MAKNIKKFNKNVNENSMAMAIYNEYKGVREAIEIAERQENEYCRIYGQMEGKYAIGTTAEGFGGQGTRGYGYCYPSVEARVQEAEERDAYYTEYIAPLRVHIQDLQRQADKLNNDLCVALWGFDYDHYLVYDELCTAEKELKCQQMRVERLRKEWEAMR
jgi:hypothetical protein